MKSKPGDLCPPEGHGAVVELDVRHLGLSLKLGVGVTWQGVGNGLTESLIGDAVVPATTYSLTPSAAPPPRTPRTPKPTGA